MDSYFIYRFISYIMKNNNNFLFIFVIISLRTFFIIKIIILIILNLNILDKTNVLVNLFNLTTVFCESGAKDNNFNNSNIPSMVTTNPIFNAILNININPNIIITLIEPRPRPVNRVLDFVNAPVNPNLVNLNSNNNNNLNQYGDYGDERE